MKKVLALILTVSILLVSCAVFAESEPEKFGGSAIVQIYFDPSNINFYADLGSTGWMLFNTCGAALVRMDNEGNIVPQLIDTWDRSEDGLTWKFHIRENAGWSDGTPITVDDIIFTAKYWRQDGFTDFAMCADTMYIDETPVYEKVDDYNYTVTTQNPYLTILDFYALNFYTMPKHVFENVPASEFFTTDINTVPGEIVCGGPFKVVEQKIGEYVKLTKNEYYWDEVYLDNMYLRIALDSNACYTALQTGELDLAFVADEMVASAEKDGLQVFNYCGMTTNTLLMNTKDPILSDVNVRKAISCFYDQQLMIDQFYGGKGYINKGVFNEYMRFNNPDACTYYEHSIEQGQAYLEAAGWEKGSDGYYCKDGKVLELTYIYGAGYDDFMAMLFQAMFADTGVKMNIEGYEYNVIEDKLASGEYQIGPAGFFNGVEISSYYPDYLNNYSFSGYRSDAMDAAWVEGNTAIDNEARQVAYDKIQAEISDQALWMVLPMTISSYVGSARIQLDEADFNSQYMFTYPEKVYVLK